MRDRMHLGPMSDTLTVATPLATSPADTGPTTSRMWSIDVARGIVMVLMAIDHVRVYAGVSPGGPDPAIFFTRWVTHFCAPAFVFLAGTSAFLYGRRHDDLSRFLATRGLWLIVLELTVLRLGWTFNADFAGYNMAGVIWVIGWSMLILAALVKLPAAVVTALGLAVVFGHNLLVVPEDPGWLWKVMYVGFWSGPVETPVAPLMVLYSMVPWVGVMALGYGFGRVALLEPGRRDRACLAIGGAATVLFLALRAGNLYGEPNAWSADGDMPALLSFLNTSKYPASLQFLLMTLGPTIAALPLLERMRGAIGGVLALFGRVPFFFYVLHIPLIHAIALLVARVRTPEATWWLFTNHPMGNPPPPDGYTWSLPLLYGVWALAVVLLYVACRWFAGVKARRRDWWLSYL